MIKRQLLLTSRWFLGLLFAATGIGKLLDNRGFAGVIASYQTGLDSALMLPLGLIISLLELYIGVNLLLSRRLVLSLLATLFFHLFYTGLALITLYRGIELDNCGCFGIFWARPLTTTTPIEDLALSLISLLSWLGHLHSSNSG